MINIAETISNTHLTDVDKSRRSSVVRVVHPYVPTIKQLKLISCRRVVLTKGGNLEIMDRIAQTASKALE
jgi:hypothetical protein